MTGSRAWARHLGAPALAVALGALELALVRLAGPPGRQLEVLRQLGQVGADPLASVLALLAVAAEGLAAYLLAVLGLRLLASLPGVVGRLASGVTLLVTPASVRRALDLLLGGALLAQVTFVPLPTRAGATAAPVAAGPAQTTATPLSTAPAATPPPAGGGLAWARPGQDRPVAPAPLPPWLVGWPPVPGDGGPVGPEEAASGGGPAGPDAAGGRRSAAVGDGPVGRRVVPDRPRRPKPAAMGAGGHRGGVAGTHTVRPGDTLWRIAAAHLPPAWRSPAAIERFDVSVNTVRAAIVQLKAEGLVTSHQGRGVFVQKPSGLHRLSSDIVTAEGFYTMVRRQGERPTTVTEVRREGASEEVANALGVEVGSEVVVRARVMGTDRHPLACLATSYFPTWVVDAAPNLADPNVSGLPKWLREAFGPTYSDDNLDARMPTDSERERLEIPENVPVILNKGFTYDGQHRTLHFIDMVVVPGRMPLTYRFGVVPEG